MLLFPTFKILRALPSDKKFHKNHILLIHGVCDLHYIFLDFTGSAKVKEMPCSYNWPFHDCKAGCAAITTE